ncbi:DUF4369 domain-containing protein [Flavobacterium cerinum]|uniref:DUF4369 domain-containing protein n=1 Tax=Flavobacterium cerinum TaxID=2502784 RepID=A0A444HDU1_9FLAO|nr:DUF4369 domain-containing protein [Flavobacterium cerinum]RWX02430.1 DUF4369 domain-containing protein [Flavobacterium cerinum]
MKRSILALMALVLLTACNNNDHGDTNLHITGNIKGLKQGKLYIQRVVDTTLVAIDTIVINGKSSFESHLKIDSPEMLYLFLDRGQTNSIDNSLPFFAEPGNMKIETSNDEFFYRAKVTGSKNQKLYEDFLQMKTRFTNDNLALVEKNLEATKNSNVKQLDSIATKADQLIRRRYLFTANFALNNAKHEIGPYIALSEIADVNIKYLDTIQKNMSPEVAKSLYGKMLTKYVAERKKAATEAVK